jgi:hypothetical protein
MRGVLPWNRTRMVRRGSFVDVTSNRSMAASAASSSRSFLARPPPGAITGRLNDRHQRICRLNSPSLLVPGEAYVRPVTSIISARVACSKRLPNRMTVGSKIVFSSYCFTLDPSFHSLQKWIGSEALNLGPIAFMQGRMADPSHFLDWKLPGAVLSYPSRLRYESPTI